MVALLSWDGSLIRGKLSHIQHSEHPTMVSIRRIVTQWGRRIVGGLIVTLLFSQMALAMYACPKLDADTHAASMQMAGMAMDEAAGMSAMPDCHAMPCQGRWTTSLRSCAVPIAAVTASPRRLRKGWTFHLLRRPMRSGLPTCFPWCPTRNHRPAPGLTQRGSTTERALSPSISLSKSCAIDTPGRARRALARQNT